MQASYQYPIHHRPQHFYQPPIIPQQLIFEHSLDEGKFPILQALKQRVKMIEETKIRLDDNDPKTEFTPQILREYIESANKKVLLWLTGYSVNPLKKYQKIDYKIYADQYTLPIVRDLLKKFTTDYGLKNIQECHFNGGVYYDIKNIRITVILDSTTQSISVLDGIQVSPSQNCYRISFGHTFASDNEIQKAWNHIEQQEFFVDKPGEIRNLLMWITTEQTEGSVVSQDLIEFSQKNLQNHNQLKILISGLYRQYSSPLGKTICTLNLLSHIQRNPDLCKHIAKVYLTDSKELNLDVLSSLINLIHNDPTLTPVLLNFIKGFLLCAWAKQEDNLAGSISLFHSPPSVTTPYLSPCLAVKNKDDAFYMPMQKQPLLLMDVVNFIKSLPIIKDAALKSNKRGLEIFDKLFDCLGIDSNHLSNNHEATVKSELIHFFDNEHVLQYCNHNPQRKEIYQLLLMNASNEERLILEQKIALCQLDQLQTQVTNLDLRLLKKCLSRIHLLTLKKTEDADLKKLFDLLSKTIQDPDLQKLGFTKDVQTIIQILLPTIFSHTLFPPNKKRLTDSLHILKMLIEINPNANHVFALNTWLKACQQLSDASNKKKSVLIEFINAIILDNKDSLIGQIKYLEHDFFHTELEIQCLSRLTISARENKEAEFKRILMCALGLNLPSHNQLVQLQNYDFINQHNEITSLLQSISIDKKLIPAVPMQITQDKIELSKLGKFDSSANLEVTKKVIAKVIVLSKNYSKQTDKEMKPLIQYLSNTLEYRIQKMDGDKKFLVIPVFVQLLTSLATLKKADVFDHLNPLLDKLSKYGLLSTEQKKTLSFELLESYLNCNKCHLSRFTEFVENYMNLRNGAALSEAESKLLLKAFEFYAKNGTFQHLKVVVKRLFVFLKNGDQNSQESANLILQSIVEKCLKPNEKGFYKEFALDILTQCLQQGLNFPKFNEIFLILCKDKDIHRDKLIPFRDQIIEKKIFAQLDLEKQLNLFPFLVNKNDLATFIPFVKSLFSTFNRSEQDCNLLFQFLKTLPKNHQELNITSLQYLFAIYDSHLNDLTKTNQQLLLEIIFSFGKNQDKSVVLKLMTIFNTQSVVNPDQKIIQLLTELSEQPLHEFEEQFLEPVVGFFDKIFKKKMVRSFSDDSLAEFNKLFFLILDEVIKTKSPKIREKELIIAYIKETQAKKLEKYTAERLANLYEYEAIIKLPALFPELPEEGHFIKLLRKHISRSQFNQHKVLLGRINVLTEDQINDIINSTDILYPIFQDSATPLYIDLISKILEITKEKENLLLLSQWVTQLIQDKGLIPKDELKYPLNLIISTLLEERSPFFLEHSLIISMFLLKLCKKMDDQIDVFTHIENIGLNYVALCLKNQNVYELNPYYLCLDSYIAHFLEEKNFHFLYAYSKTFMWTTTNLVSLFMMLKANNDYKKIKGNESSELTPNDRFLDLMFSDNILKNPRYQLFHKLYSSDHSQETKNEKNPLSKETLNDIFYVLTRSQSLLATFGVDIDCNLSPEIEEKMISVLLNASIKLMKLHYLIGLKIGISPTLTIREKEQLVFPSYFQDRARMLWCVRTFIKEFIPPTVDVEKLANDFEKAESENRIISMISPKDKSKIKEEKQEK